MCQECQYDHWRPGYAHEVDFWYCDTKNKWILIKILIKEIFSEYFQFITSKIPKFKFSKWKIEIQKPKDPEDIDISDIPF